MHASRWFCSLCVQGIELGASKKAPRLCYEYNQGLYTRVWGLAKPGARLRAQPNRGGEAGKEQKWPGQSWVRGAQSRAGERRLAPAGQGAGGGHMSPSQPSATEQQPEAGRWGCGDSGLYFGNGRIPGAAPRFYERRRAGSCAGSKTAPRGCQHGASPPWHGSAASPEARSPARFLRSFTGQVTQPRTLSPFTASAPGKDPSPYPGNHKANSAQAGVLEGSPAGNISIGRGV